MEVIELMMPRFEVIAEYPKCEFTTGQVLVRIKYATLDVYHSDEDACVGGMELSELEKYPHLFRKMDWWERRSIDEMPKKVVSKFDDKGETFEIEEWDMEHLLGWVDKSERTCCELTLFKPEYGYFPID